MLKDCSFSSFISYITEIIKLQVDEVLEINPTMLMYDLIEYSYSYFKTSGSL